MSLRPERELQHFKSPSPPSDSETSRSSEGTLSWYRHSASPHLHQQHAPCASRPMQSLPPLRDFLRGEGLSPSLEARRVLPDGARYGTVAPAHAAAREDALQRALGRASTYRQTPAHPPYGPPATVAHSRSGHHVSDGGPRREYRDSRSYSDSERRNPAHAVKKPVYPVNVPPMITPNASPPAPAYQSLSPYSHPGYSQERSYPAPSISQVHDKAMEALKRPDMFAHRSVSAPTLSSAHASSRVAHEAQRKRKLPEGFEQSDSEDEHDELDPDQECAYAVPRSVAERNKDVHNMDLQRHGSVSSDKGLNPSGPSYRSNRIIDSPTAVSPRSDGQSADFDDGPTYFTPSGVKLEVKELPVIYDTKEWLKHVERSPESGKAQWRCTWETMKNGSPMPCDYSSKKHLVKRHIEATHLRIKRFQCTWCGKTFTQRSNVAGCHLNTHTGESPHGCEFCGERFKDPSKRHKHMTRYHSYRPNKGKKKFKAADAGPSAVSAHESLPPWTVSPPSSAE
ncbi:hypothetical protein FA95DRAFT_1552128 [Auriscalpium vulgare]|uniref:Uncharacterized protein n=1 Tax=Auriscalpium vulgare TaxID=40419 RepID=A0ACB8SCM0_9AGAM|nr:hypothetical protein FA95DRAFT_1552128 [Auriscalpium vulgare]